MSQPSDNSLDARLRDVPLPPGMKDRLKASLAPSDDELDEWLRRVAVPETLTLALRDVPDDVVLDEQLADVNVPISLAANLRQVPAVHRNGRARTIVAQLFRLALAASWLFALTVTMLGGIGAIVTAVLPLARDGGGLIAVNINPSSPERLTTARANNTSLSRRCPLTMAQAAAVSVATLPRRHGRRFSQIWRLTSPTWQLVRAPGPAAQWTAALDAGLRPLDDVMLLKFGVLGSPVLADDRLPEIDTPLMPRAVGIQPPLVRGYDRGFFLKHRLFPPISPAANPQLASLAVPLVTDSDVLSRLARSLAEGRVPAAGRAANRRLSRRDEPPLCRRSRRQGRHPHGRRTLAVWFAGSSQLTERGAAASRRAGWRPDATLARGDAPRARHRPVA